MQCYHLSLSDSPGWPPHCPSHATSLLRTGHSLLSDDLPSPSNPSQLPTQTLPLPVACLGPCDPRRHLPSEPQHPALIPVRVLVLCPHLTSGTLESRGLGLNVSGMSGGASLTLTRLPRCREWELTVMISSNFSIKCRESYSDFVGTRSQRYVLRFSNDHTVEMGLDASLAGLPRA